MAIGAFHVHHFEFVNILQSKFIVIFLLERRWSEYQPFLKTASLIPNYIKNNLCTKKKSIEMKLRSAGQCCVLAGPPREVRQPRKLTCNYNLQIERGGGSRGMRGCGTTVAVLPAKSLPWRPWLVPSSSSSFGFSPTIHTVRKWKWMAQNWASSNSTFQGF